MKKYLLILLVAVVGCTSLKDVTDFVDKNPSSKELFCPKTIEKHKTDTLIKEKIVIQEPSQVDLDNYTQFMHSVDSMACQQALDSMKAKCKPQGIKIKYMTTTIIDTITVIDKIASEKAMRLQQDIDSTYYTSEITRIKDSQPSTFWKYLAITLGVLLILAIGFIVALFLVVRTAKSKGY